MNDQWLYRRGDDVVGPLPLAELFLLLERGTLPLTPKSGQSAPQTRGCPPTAETIWRPIDELWERRSARSTVRFGRS